MLKLPGETNLKDAKGHKLFECFLCGKHTDIFGRTQAVSDHSVCHSCAAECIDRMCKVRQATIDNKGQTT